MRAINLYTISRKIHRELRPLYEKALSGRDKETKVREEEIDLIAILVNNFIFHKAKLFGVTTDYLLNDEYESDNDLPKIKEVKNDSFHQILILVITLEVMILIIQFMTTIILQNTFFSVLSFIPFVASIGGFEYAYQKKKNEANETTNVFRKKFYKISAWLGAYFPIRFVITSLSHFYPRPYSMIALECVIFVLYLIMATLLCFQIEKNSLKGK